MEKTIICLAKLLAEKEAANIGLFERNKKLEGWLNEWKEAAKKLQLLVDGHEEEVEELNGRIANLEKVIAEREAQHLNLLQKVAELEQAAEAKPKKCGNTKPRTQAQLEVLKRGREKAAAKRAAAKRANGITPERPTAEELLRIAEGADL